ncbi:MAG: hypothetical protein PUE18_05110 [Firmicutes bacterium]|nr:hypothetical protein [Bacillota bacterium]
MKKALLFILILVFSFGCLGCQPQQEVDADKDEPANYLLDVSFTATVVELIDDENTEADVPRYAVVQSFQIPPVLVDVGEALGKTLEEDESYTIVMEQKTVEMITESYDLATVIPLYGLKVKSIEAPSKDLQGADAVSIVYSELIE